MVKSLLEKRIACRVIPLRFGYFDLLRFWFPFGTRTAPIKRLTRLIQLVRADHSTAHLSVIAHSFGTFAITRILMQNRHIRINRLILCGSVVPENFRWENVTGQLERPVLNECGTLDIWPVLASLMTCGYGATGTLGFGDPAVTDRYHRFSHSGFFDHLFVQKFWVPFLEDGTISETEEVHHQNPWWMAALSSALARWTFLAILIFALLTLPYRASYNSRSDPIGRAFSSFGFKRTIPGSTG
jgi:hypothetical protein